MGEQLASTETALIPAAPNCKPKAKRLTQAEVALVLQLHKDGKTQAEIAQLLSITQQSVSQWLRNTTDTTDTAKLYLRGSALRMAQNIVKKGLPRDHVAALKGLSVLEEERSAGLVIQIGVKDSDVAITLAPTFASPVSTLSTDIHKLSDASGSDNS